MFDLIVLGGGPGGYVAAIRAAQCGLTVAVIEREKLGGICLNWGCVPTKSLLKSSGLLRILEHKKDFGIEGEFTSNVSSMVARSRKIAEKLSRGIHSLMKKHHITVIEGHGRIVEKKGEAFVLDVCDTQKNVTKHQARRIIVATGSRARTLPGHTALWSAREAMLCEHVPQRLLIVGCGAIGMEFASFYNALGTSVTLIERAQRILLSEDDEIAASAQKVFEKQGMQFFVGHDITEITHNGIHHTITVRNQKTQKDSVIEADHVLVAIGVVGNVENCGLENTNVRVEQGTILVNHNYETHEPGIYAIGDVIGAPWLAHKASHEGIHCVNHIAGKHVRPLNKHHIPGCIYTSPQIASVGIHEKVAREKHIPIKVGKFPFAANAQALAHGETEGFIKLIFHVDTGELLGAHMLGTQVSELIGSMSVAMALEATDETLKDVVFPHPTLSEMLHEAILDADKEALHF